MSAHFTVRPIFGVIFQRAENTLPAMLVIGFGLCLVIEWGAAEYEPDYF